MVELVKSADSKGGNFSKATWDQGFRVFMSFNGALFLPAAFDSAKISSYLNSAKIEVEREDAENRFANFNATSVKVGKGVSFRNRSWPIETEK